MVQWGESDNGAKMQRKGGQGGQGLEGYNEGGSREEDM